MGGRWGRLRAPNDTAEDRRGHEGAVEESGMGHGGRGRWVLGLGGSMGRELSVLVCVESGAIHVLASIPVFRAWKICTNGFGDI